MRRYQIALLIAVIAIALLGAALGYLWIHPHSAPPVQKQKMAAAKPTTTPMSPEPAEPQLLPVQLLPQRMQSIGVTTGAVEFKTLRNTLRTTGNVAVDETRVVPVQVRYSGWVQRVFAAEVVAEQRRIPDDSGIGSHELTLAFLPRCHRTVGVGAPVRPGAGIEGEAGTEQEQPRGSQHGGDRRP